jgi:hypothetical protein
MESIKSELTKATKRLDAMWVSLYTREFIDCGPITETDEVPFN